MIPIFLSRRYTRNPLERNVLSSPDFARALHVVVTPLPSNIRPNRGAKNSDAESIMRCKIFPRCQISKRSVGIAFLPTGVDAAPLLRERGRPFPKSRVEIQQRRAKISAGLIPKNLGIRIDFESIENRSMLYSHSKVSILFFTIQ